MPLMSGKYGGSRPVPSCGRENSDERWNFVLLTVAIIFVFTICAIYTVAAG